MLLQANPEVVDRLIAAYSPSSLTGLGDVRTALAAAIRASMQNPQLYTQTPIDGQLRPGNALEATCHPYNLAAALIHVCAATGVFTQPALPVQEDVYVYASGNWVAVAACAAPPLLRPIIAPQPVLAAPAPVQPPATTFAQLEQADPAIFANPGQEANVRAAAGLTDAEAAQRLAAVEGVAPAAAQEPHGGARVPGSALPNPDVTRSITTAAGRSAKSPFDREYRPRERIGAMPSWWPGVSNALSTMFTKDPAEAVPVENSPSPVMEYTLALSIVERLLHSVPDHLSAGELKNWVREVGTRIDTSAAAPVAYDIVNKLSEQKAEAANGTKGKKKEANA